MTTDDILAPHEREAAAEVQGAAVAVAARAGNVTITNEDEAQAAGELLRQIAGRRRRAEEARVFLVKPLNDHVKAINAQFKPTAEVLAKAEREIRASMATYLAAVAAEEAAERARLEEEAAAVRRADEEAQAAREAAAAEARAAWARAAEAREAAAAAQPSPEALASAAAARAAEQASAQLEAARRATPLPVRTTPQVVPQARPAGVSTRKRWTHEVVDAELVPAEYRPVDESLIRKAVVAGVREIPGVRIYQADGLAVRS